MVVPCKCPSTCYWRIIVGEIVTSCVADCCTTRAGTIQRVDQWLSLLFPMLVVLKTMWWFKFANISHSNTMSVMYTALREFLDVERSRYYGEYFFDQPWSRSGGRNEQGLNRKYMGCTRTLGKSDDHTPSDLLLVFLLPTDKSNLCVCVRDFSPSITASFPIQPLWRRQHHIFYDKHRRHSSFLRQDYWPWLWSARTELPRFTRGEWFFSFLCLLHLLPTKARAVHHKQEKWITPNTLPSQQEST